MIIDAHAHIFPDKIAEKASAGISGFYDGMSIDSGGTLGELLRKGAEAGVDRFLVQSVATVPRQVTTINDYIAECVRDDPERLIGFGALHPDFEDVGDEVERIVELGLRGIKLHSDFQDFNIDDERAFPIYEAASENGLPILFHVGDRRSDRSAPERLLRVVKLFPKLTVIGAHLAGWSMWDRGAELFGGYIRENPECRFYTDCSSSLYAMSPEHAAELIRTFGAERVMWGTDYPMWNAKEELLRFFALTLTEREQEMILSKNLQGLLGEI